MSVFRFAKAAQLSLPAPDGFGNDLTFTGSWEIPAPQSYDFDVALNWTRWQLTVNSTVVIQDTGKVWGATDYTWTPEPIAPGVNYVVRFSAETTLGQEMLATYGPFDVLQENLVSVTGPVSAVCVPGQDAVKVSIESEETLPSELVGTVVESGSKLSISVNSSITTPVPGSNYPSVPWSFMWVGEYKPNFPLFRLIMADGSEISMTCATGPQFMPQPGVDTYVNNLSLTNGEQIFVVFTSGYRENMETTGYQWLVYNASDPTKYYNGKVTAGYTQKQIAAVELPQRTNPYWWTVGWGAQNAGFLRAPDNDYTPEWIGPQAIFHHEADSGTDGQMLYLGTEPAGNEAIYRQTVSDTPQQPIFIGKLTEPPGVDFYPVIYDYTAQNGQTYQYYVTVNADDDENAATIQSAEVSPCFWNWTLLEASPVDGNRYTLVREYRFVNNVSTSEIANGGERGVYATFTRYTAVMRGTQNRKAGTLSGLIGTVSVGDYSDDNDTRDAIYALSTSKNALFLKNRRGDFLRVAISGEIVMRTGDNSAKQEQTASVPWVEIGSAAGCSVYSAEWEEYPPEPEVET